MSASYDLYFLSLSTFTFLPYQLYVTNKIKSKFLYKLFGLRLETKQRALKTNIFFSVSQNRQQNELDIQLWTTVS